MHLRGVVTLLVASVALAACVHSSGQPVAAISQPAIAAAYIPLRGGFLGGASGAAVAFAPGVAVTNAHNKNIVPSGTIVGEPREGGYDLLFFRTSKRAVPVTAAPRLGQQVTAYGQGADHELRIAHGVVRQLPTPNADYFVFEGNAGPGFSGGPVVDTAGNLVGIIFGYVDRNSVRLIYAYDASRVQIELSTIRNSTSK